MATPPENLNRTHLLRNLLAAMLREHGTTVLPAVDVEEDQVQEQFILTDGPGADYTLQLVVPTETLIV